MEPVMAAAAVARLAGRKVLPLDPASSVAIKRDVHELEVTTNASTFTAAFRAVMTDPSGRFGLIQVKRPAERIGREFEVGERFQGCFSLARALGSWASRRGPRATAAVARLLALPAARAAATWIEDQMLSDYAEIQELVLSPDPARGEVHRLRYRYLDGTPIAGSSIFLVEPLGPSRCRVRQIFEYQEQNGIALGTFQRFGLKYHDQVVAAQIRQAAARAGAEVVSSTVPAAYEGLAS